MTELHEIKTRLTYGPLFRGSRALLRLLVGRDTIVGGEYLCQPSVCVCHHQNMYGPIHTMLTLDGLYHPWTLAIFHTKRDALRHYYSYTFRVRWGWGRLRSGICALLAGPYVSALTNSAGAVPVWRGQRQIMETFARTLDLLLLNHSVIIYPDVDYTNKEGKTGELYDGFLHLEKMYYRQTGRHLPFVPMCCNRREHSLYIGEPVVFRGDLPFREEKVRVANELRDALNQLATDA